jgi:phosphate transport system ATP-binding protein
MVELPPITTGLSPALDAGGTLLGKHRAREVWMPDVKMETESLCAWYGGRQALHDVSLRIPDGLVTAIIGPSGCGKTTFLRCLNRLHEETPGARATGAIRLDGEDLSRQEVVRVRFRVGMVFQKPTPFPHMSIYDNVAAGLRLMGVRERHELDEGVVEALQLAGLWTEVEENVDALGTSLSGGQQQRLCIARALAVRPEVLLMDEPCSSLDPIATDKIESLIQKLKRTVTIVIVTHNLAQATRVSDYTAFFYLGKLIEAGTTPRIFEMPEEKMTENYVTGRFG